MKPVSATSAVKEVGILGEGAFGTAIACLLADNGCGVKLWCHDQDTPRVINATGINQRYLPNIQLSSFIETTTQFNDLFSCQYIFEAIPVKFLRSVLTEARPYVQPDHIWVMMSKGIENTTLQFPSQILADICGSTRVCALTGPSLAYDVATRKPTAVVLAGDCSVVLPVQQLLANDYFRPYSSTDLMGAQVGGALKNVISVLMGMAIEAQLSEDTKAFLFTRGLHEIAQLAEILGGRAQTIYGLAGVGDLVLSSLSGKGRNAKAGALLVQGKSLGQIENELGGLPEGINTIISLHQLIEQRSLDMPICASMYEIVYAGRTVGEVVQRIINRPLEQECKV